MTVTEKVENGYYTTKLEHPKKPEGYKRDGYVYDENQTVKWNREHQEKLSEEYMLKLAEYHKDANTKEFEFQNDLIQELQTEYNITEIQASNAFKLAWEEEHADGIISVIDRAKFYAEFIRAILNDERFIY